MNKMKHTPIIYFNNNYQTKTYDIPQFAFWCMLWGLLFCTVGAALNMSVMIANGGKMPVRADILGVYPKHFFFQENSEVEKWYLADIINLSVGEHYAYFSPGDAFVFFGYVIFIGGSLSWFRYDRRKNKWLKDSIKEVVRINENWNNGGLIE